MLSFYIPNLYRSMNSIVVNLTIAELIFIAILFVLIIIIAVTSLLKNKKISEFFERILNFFIYELKWW